jgi:hypothetical protein
MCYGRPCTIQDADWDVSVVYNLDDTSTRCPGFEGNSVEILEDGSHTDVTNLSYQRFKYRLYRIASPILEAIYLYKAASIHEVVDKIKGINERLLAWERDLPRELRLRSFHLETLPPNTNTIKIFRLQALTLQLFYDNVQLLLHRPLLAYDAITLLGSSRMIGPPPRNGSFEREADTRPSSSRISAEICQSSRDQCYESAIRTSRVITHEKILVEARNTPAAPYIGIQSFTAGAMLGIFALSIPFTDCAQQAKQGIGRLAKMPKVLGFRTPVSKQCGSVLEELILLVLAEERKCLISDTGAGNGEGFSSRALLSSPPTRQLSPRLAPRDINDSEPYPNCETTETRSSAGLRMRETSNPTEANEEYGVAMNETFAYQGAVTEDFHNAVASLQNGMNIFMCMLTNLTLW